ncbi:CocE/NonD family hydrolase [Streptomyces sp. MB09-02B]|uniref:CocE/NonD family hydrolase n=1 Tax=Streptomyces sp. MB09-02B TaxID=3028667 RepID=UPI0029A5A967|nr:CocE/NonD family hydrolase [Streptomyces sp. MB09-02B]MDX3638097.1 CocE/NonD family hydrolase [Streptomyces sp. MB09-02B]
MPGVTIDYDVPATMRDGTVLRADVYRPAADGPWPVLLARLPYGKNTSTVNMLDPVGMARRGTIVVVQDTRGRYASEGEWEPWTFESDDGYDTVRWAATLPDSNGSVGMYGASYFGNTQWMAALAKPPELKAIAPMITWSDPYDGVFCRGGVEEFGLNLWWSLWMGFDTLTRRHADDLDSGSAELATLVREFDGLAKSGYWDLPSGRHPAFQRNRLHDLGLERSRREPEWAASCRVAGRHDEIDLPTLNIGGWYDLFCQGTLDNFTAMRAAGRPAKLIMGPWAHGDFLGQVGDVNFGTAASGEALDFRGTLGDIQHGWFRHWLAGDTEAGDADAAQLPPVLLFVSGINQWREEQQWPLARAVDTEYFLRADGHLTDDRPKEGEGGDTYVYDPADPVPTTGGAALMSSEFRPGPLDQARVEARPDVLVYTTEPLTEDVEVTGRIRAFLHAATDAPTTDWVVRLCDVAPEGVSINIVDGVVRVVTSPGEFAEHEVDLWSTSHVFRVGHRIRVHVTSSNFPRWDRNLNTAEPIDSATEGRPARQEVAHDATRPSRVVLPVVPAS